MTKNEFHNLCSMLYVETSLALENERVIEALRNHESYDEIAQILTEEF
jgi:HD superfamily phosphohydrolase YqeK